MNINIQGLGAVNIKIVIFLDVTMRKHQHLHPSSRQNISLETLVPTHHKHNVMFQKNKILKEYSPLVIINVFKMLGPWTNKTKPTYLSFIGCKRNLIYKNCDNYIGCIVFRLLLWILYMFMCYPYCKYFKTPLIFSANKSTAYDIK
jgi:hypothetical protein